MDNIKEAFLRVKDDINELKAEMKKLAERLDNLAIEVKKRK